MLAKVPFYKSDEVIYYVSSGRIGYVMNGFRTRKTQGQGVGTNMEQFGMIIGYALDLMRQNGKDIGMIQQNLKNSENTLERDGVINKIEAKP
jgi:hypothetical protein